MGRHRVGAVTVLDRGPLPRDRSAAPLPSWKPTWLWWCWWVGGLWGLRNHDEGAMASQSATRASPASAARAAGSMPGRRPRLGNRFPAAAPATSAPTLGKKDFSGSAAACHVSYRVRPRFSKASQSRHLCPAQVSIKPHRPRPARQNSVFMHPSKRPAAAGWLAGCLQIRVMMAARPNGRSRRGPTRRVNGLLAGTRRAGGVCHIRGSTPWGMDLKGPRLGRDIIRRREGRLQTTAAQPC